MLFKRQLLECLWVENSKPPPLTLALQTTLLSWSLRALIYSRKTPERHEENNTLLAVGPENYNKRKQTQASLSKGQNSPSKEFCKAQFPTQMTPWREKKKSLCVSKMGL